MSVVLADAREDDGPRRHVDALLELCERAQQRRPTARTHHGERLGRKQHLDEAALEQHLDDLHRRRQQERTQRRTSPLTSFTIGSRPPWCTPMPRASSSRMRAICGRLLSEPVRN